MPPVASTPATLFVRGARQLVTMRGPAPRRGLSCSDLGVIRDGSLLVVDGCIAEAGSTRRIENLRRTKSARLIDVSGKVVVPGLIDTHMRLEPGPPRLQAFEQRIAGLAPPGGTGADRRAGQTAVERARRWLQLAAACGATTVEVRSGRGDAPLQELRALRAAALLDGDPIQVRAGYTAAAPAPGEEAGMDAVQGILQRAAAPVVVASSFDLDCSGDAVDWSGAERLLTAAVRHGYLRRVQAHAARPTDGLRLAIEAGALSVERLDGAGEADIDLLAASPVVGLLLPNVAFHTAAGVRPPARRMLDRGVILALASGFNPDGRPGFGLQTAMALGCRELRLMPEEALVCCTINAAAAIGLTARIGSLEPGKDADLAVFDVSDYREIPYFFGVNLCVLTMRRGRVVYRSGPRGRKELE